MVRVIKAMIRDQLPDFHFHLDWKAITRRASSRVAADIQDIILEQVADAVRAKMTKLQD